jgi:hypothetical protein
MQSLEILGHFSPLFNGPDKREKAHFHSFEGNKQSEKGRRGGRGKIAIFPLPPLLPFSLCLFLCKCLLA